MHSFTPPLIPPPVPSPNWDYSGWLPVGAVIQFAGEIAGAATDQDHQSPVEAYGWMVCDGRELDVSSFPELFAVLGFRYGGNQNDRFKLPDYRGTFLRGVDGGADVDPDISTRQAPSGGTGGTEEVGSTQDDAIQTHEHIYDKADAPATPSNTGQAAGASAVTPTLTEDGPTSSLSPPGEVKVSENETRPRNTYIYFLIKYAEMARRMT